MSKTKTLEEFKKDLYNVWGNKYVISPNAVYVNNHTKIKLVCEKHGEFEIEPNAVLHKHGCKECRSETVGKNRVLSHDEVIRRLKNVWGDKYDFREVKYINARTKIDVICKKHGKFKALFTSLEDGHGCPFCCESRLENEIDRFLSNKKIFYERQYTTEWLKNGIGLLKLDFYLPDSNIAIECQGKQHYTNKSRYGESGEFEKIQERDLRKFKLCNEHGIKLLYYTDYKGEIPEIYKPFTYYDKEKLIK